MAAKLATVATKKVTRLKQAVGTSEEALQLGEVAAPAWVMLVNRSATSYVEVKTATAGVVFAKLLAGEFCLLRLGSGAQVPFVIANTASCQLDVLVCSL